MTDIIPDTIEPYVGWKALVIDHRGNLRSPNQPTVWPTGRKLEATCIWNRQHAWVAIPRTVNRKLGPHNSQPNLPLQPDWHWSYEYIDHDAVEEDCTCGIYAVNDPAIAAHYLPLVVGGIGQGVLAEVALWGRVIPGDKGARGQYAYPQRLHCLPQDAHWVQFVAERYGCELVIDNLCEQACAAAARRHNPPQPRKRSRLHKINDAALAMLAPINGYFAYRAIEAGRTWIAAMSLVAAALAAGITLLHLKNL